MRSPSADNYTRSITRIERVVDGDTFEATVDLGYHVAVLSVSFRLARVNAPEMGSRASATRQPAMTAMEFTQDWLLEHAQHAGGLYASSAATDNWRRYLAEIECGEGHNLSTDLLESGNAVLYLAKR